MFKYAGKRTEASGSRPRKDKMLYALLCLAVLIPSALSAVLGASLEQTKAELGQLRQNEGSFSSQPGEPENTGGEDPGDTSEGPSQEENGGPEHPAYQDLYPELYAEPHDWNSVVEEKVVYLTFDDGPSARTPEILEILDRYGIKATFFTVGKDSEQGRQWMRDIVAAGHTLGIHSYTHNYEKIYDSVEAYLDDFARMYELILEATGTAPRIFRFPGGSVNAHNGAIYQEIVSEMIRRGFVYYDWNRQNGDAVRKPPSAAVLARNALDKLGTSSRVIVLMHDSSSHVNTVAALPAIIEGYQQAGYTLKALTPEVKPIIYGYPNPK